MGISRHQHLWSQRGGRGPSEQTLPMGSWEVVSLVVFSIILIMKCAWSESRTSLVQSQNWKLLGLKGRNGGPGEKRIGPVSAS